MDTLKAVPLQENLLDDRSGGNTCKPSKQEPDVNPSQVLSLSYIALRRARHTIEDFVKSYFAYHELEPLAFLRWWDILVFVEGTIYQLDEENEHLAKQGIVSRTTTSPPGAALVGVLRSKGLLTAELEAELGKGFEYWEGERRLCSKMLCHGTISAEGHDPGFNLHDVHTTSLGKSFDYRVLNLLLYALRRQPPEPLLLEFLQADEHLVDIGDDLVDYEEDVARNSFNIYRAYVHLYGLNAPLELANRISCYEGKLAELLQQLPENAQRHYKQRQQDAANSEAALRWTFPQPILDEKAFREEHADGGSSEESETFTQKTMTKDCR